MTDNVRHPLSVARLVAEAVVHHLRPFSARVEVAGSVRRKVRTVKDIEVVLQPAIESEEKDLFGHVEKTYYMDPQKGLDAYNATEKHPVRLRDVEGKDGITRILDGDRFKAIEDTLTGVPIDLFIVRPPATWGCIFFIRTGPADWNKRMMKLAHRRGLKFHEGQLVRQATHKPLETDEEEDVFRLLKIPYKTPEARR